MSLFSLMISNNGISTIKFNTLYRHSFSMPKDEINESKNEINEPYPKNMKNNEINNEINEPYSKKMKNNESNNETIISKDEMSFYEHNPFIVWDERGAFSCKCSKGKLNAPFWSKGVATHHSTAHGYSLEGEWIGNTPVSKKKSIPTEQPEEVNLKIQKELEKLEQPNPEDILFAKIQDGVQTNLVSSIVNDLKDIAKDAEIMYVFQKLKSENKIPKNITFAAFVKDLLGYYCNKFGFNFMFYQDTTKLGPVELEIQKEILKENMVK